MAVNCRPVLKFEAASKFDEDKIKSTFKKVKALSNPIRLKILKLLIDNDELCVCEIETALNLKQSKVSYHLSNLIAGGFIKRRQSGPWSFYTLNHDAGSILKLFDIK